VYWLQHLTSSFCGYNLLTLVDPFHRHGLYRYIFLGYLTLTGSISSWFDTDFSFLFLRVHSGDFISHHCWDTITPLQPCVSALCKVRNHWQNFPHKCWLRMYLWFLCCIISSFYMGQVRNAFSCKVDQKWNNCIIVFYNCAPSWGFTCTLDISMNWLNPKMHWSCPWCFITAWC
jgi:hypothetical protein